MQICSATMGFAVEDRYLIKSCERAKVVELCACVRCFLRKYGTLFGLQTVIKENDNSSTRQCTPETDQFSCRSYLISCWLKSRIML